MHLLIVILPLFLEVSRLISFHLHLPQEVLLDLIQLGMEILAGQTLPDRLHAALADGVDLLVLQVEQFEGSLLDGHIAHFNTYFY